VKIDGGYHVALLQRGQRNLNSKVLQDNQLRPIKWHSSNWERNFFIDTYIIPSLEYDIILGAPFFNKYNTLLDFKRKQLQIPPFAVSIFLTVQEACASIPADPLPIKRRMCQHLNCKHRKSLGTYVRTSVKFAQNRRSTDKTENKREQFF
jgi:hypothetical protein